MCSPQLNFLNFLADVWLFTKLIVLKVPLSPNWPTNLLNCRTPRFRSHLLLTTLVFCSTVSSPWPIRLRHSADPVSSTCYGSGLSNSHWRRMRTRHLFMLLSAIDWTAATVCWLVLATSCCKGWKSSRMLPLVWWLTGARRSEHMSPILCDLHWLPVRQRIVFKTAVLAYKCQHGMAPEYLQVYCQTISTVVCRRLRSADSGRLAVPAPGRATATAVSPPRDRVRGIVFLLNSEQQMLDLKRSDANWRHYYSTCSYDCSAFAAF